MHAYACVCTHLCMIVYACVRVRTQVSVNVTTCVCAHVCTLLCDLSGTHVNSLCFICSKATLGRNVAQVNMDLETGEVVGKLAFRFVHTVMMFIV